MLKEHFCCGKAIMEVHARLGWAPGEVTSIFMPHIFPVLSSSLPFWLLHPPVLASLLSFCSLIMKLSLPPFIFQSLCSQSPESLPPQKLSISPKMQNWNNKTKWMQPSSENATCENSQKGKIPILRSAIAEDSTTKCFCLNRKCGAGLNTHWNWQGHYVNNLPWKPTK